jgi:hypothetical protein
VTHTPKIYPKAGLEKNFCRNPAPDEEAKTIWCFIEGGTPLHFWEYCDPLGGRTIINSGGGKNSGGSKPKPKTIPPPQQPVVKPAPVVPVPVDTTGGVKFKVTTSTKVEWGKCEQASPYGGNRFPCSNAFNGGNKFTHTNKGVGMWW